MAGDQYKRAGWHRESERAGREMETKDGRSCCNGHFHPRNLAHGRRHPQHQARARENGRRQGLGVHISRSRCHALMVVQDDSIVFDALTELQKTKMTLELLQETKIGVAVNAASKGCSGKGGDLAKELIKAWKALLPASSSSSSSATNSPSKCRFLTAHHISPRRQEPAPGASSPATKPNGMPL